MLSVAPLMLFIASVLIGMGLFYRLRNLEERWAKALRRANAALASFGGNQELKEEIKTTAFIVAMLAVIPLLALTFSTSRVIRRCATALLFVPHRVG